MDEKFWQDIYEKNITPWEYHIKNGVPEEFFPKVDDKKDKLENSWKSNSDYQSGMKMKEWITLMLEHRRSNTSELSWDILKQTIDDLLDAYKEPDIILFSIIPRIKKYSSIKDYNFAHERHVKRYAEIVFEWLSFVDSYLFSIKELGEFKDGEFTFLLKDKNKERLKLLKSIINSVDVDFQRSEEQGIAYELILKDNEIRIKYAEKPLHTTEYDSPSEILFRELYNKPNTKIRRKDLEKKKIKVNGKFNSLIKDMKLVGEYGRLFVPSKSQDSAILITEIKHKKLEEKGLEYLYPDDLVKLLRKE